MEFHFKEIKGPALNFDPNILEVKAMFRRKNNVGSLIFKGVAPVFQKLENKKNQELFYKRVHHP